MAFGQIRHVDEIPPAGAVRRVVVLAENRQLLPLAHGHLGHVRHQVVGNPLGVLADQTGSVRANRVKISQKNHGHLLIGIRRIFQNLLHHVLRPTVRVRAFSAAHVFRIRHRRLFPVNGGGGTEYHPTTARLLHHFQQRQGGIDVISVILDRLLHGFSHRLQPGKMNHHVDGVFRKNSFQCVRVFHVRPVHLRPHARNLLNPPEDLRAAVIKIVGDDYVIACSNQFYCGVGPDISGAPCQ